MALVLNRLEKKLLVSLWRAIVRNRIGILNVTNFCLPPSCWSLPLRIFPGTMGFKYPTYNRKMYFLSPSGPYLATGINLVSSSLISVHWWISSSIRKLHLFRFRLRCQTWCIFPFFNCYSLKIWRWLYFRKSNSSTGEVPHVFFFSFFLFGKFWNWSRIKRIKEQDRETAETGKNVRAILVAWSFWCHFPGTALQLEMLWKISFTCSSKINERKVGRLNHQSQFISILINFCMPLVLASRNLALQARNICFRNKEINKRRWKNETSATGT